MAYSDIVCPKCKEGKLVSFNGLSKNKKGLNFTCHSCKISFKVEDEGGYLPSKINILNTKFPSLEGLSFS
ncbi:MAG: hypothetical protein U9P63_02350 [Patescibacteria group bacterium]|nr:hypothetical protein [Patescibacteria group bacterium]